MPSPGRAVLTDRVTTKERPLRGTSNGLNKFADESSPLPSKDITMDSQTKSIGQGYAKTLVEVCEVLKDQGHNIRWSYNADFISVKREVGNHKISREFIHDDVSDIEEMKRFTNDLRSLVVCPAHGSAPQLGVSA